LLLAVFLAPSGAATWKADWSVDLGPGYITTSPVADDERVYVRTSGFWTGTERPEVKAFSHTGSLEWTYRSNATTQHDMAPLVLKNAGTGACGSWPDLLLVGWANGDFTALHPANGSLAWRVNTSLDGWGITGAPLLDADHVVVPTRNGLVRLCLGNGEVDFNVNLSPGWRNGVTLAEGFYWTGSESGHLWQVGLDGSTVNSHNLSGQLRHAPVQLDDRLLLHVQHPTSSTIQTYNMTTGVLDEIHASGGSPAIPLLMEETVVFGDNEGLTSVRCASTCSVVDRLATKVNGEMASLSPTRFYAPVNSPGEGWVLAQLNTSGWFTLAEAFSTPYDGYGTSSPASVGEWLFLGNDAGVLMAYSTVSTPTENTTPGKLDVRPLLGMIGLTLAVGGSAFFARKGAFSSSWRLFSLSLLVVALMMLPEVSRTWSSTLVEDNAPSTSAWDESWPETWLGTQIVVFEFPDGPVTVGGLVGHQNVWSLTQQAAEERDIPLDAEETGLGLYLVAINGTEGSGWEYFLNGERGTLAVDDASVDSTVVVRWSLA
jgi:hypothetical protein